MMEIKENGSIISPKRCMHDWAYSYAEALWICKLCKKKSLAPEDNPKKDIVQEDADDYTGDLDNSTEAIRCELCGVVKTDQQWSDESYHFGEQHNAEFSEFAREHSLHEDDDSEEIENRLAEKYFLGLGMTQLKYETDRAYEEKMESDALDNPSYDMGAINQNIAMILDTGSVYKNKKVISEEDYEKRATKKSVLRKVKQLVDSGRLAFLVDIASGGDTQGITLAVNQMAFDGFLVVYKMKNLATNRMSRVYFPNTEAGLKLLDKAMGLPPVHAILSPLLSEPSQAVAPAPVPSDFVFGFDDNPMKNPPTCPNCKNIILNPVKSNPPGAMQCPNCEKAFVENPKIDGILGWTYGRWLYWESKSFRDDSENWVNTDLTKVPTNVRNTYVLYCAWCLWHGHMTTHASSVLRAFKDETGMPEEDYRLLRTFLFGEDR